MFNSSRIVLTTLGILILIGSAQAEKPEGNRPKQPHLLQQNLSFRTIDKTEAKFRKALSTATSVEFPGNPLGDVVDFLSTQHNIPIVIDRELAERGIDADAEVSLVISGVTFRNALNLLLDDVGGTRLSFVIRNEVMVITTEEAANNYMETRVYDLRPFNVSDLEDLSTTIVHTTGPKKWKKHSMSIGTFEGRLIIRQNQAVHTEIEGLLTTLFSGSNPTGD